MTDTAGSSTPHHMEMLRSMLLIRRTEERIAECMETGEIGCPCHLYIGQEAVAVGVCSRLRTDDFVFSTHRSHGHYLAKGGNLNRMVQEVFCRQEGCSHGWGGSMHIRDMEVGLPGSSAIVGGTIPLAVGAALAFTAQRTDRVAVVFFGDGATNEGVFYESLNLATLRRLPVIFVCENNLYSTHMHITECLSNPDISGKASAFGMDGDKVDGNNAVEVARAAGAAVERARAGRGPTLIECLTYRWRGHVGPSYDVDKGLRAPEELHAWMDRCPVRALEAHILAQKGATTDMIMRLHKEVETAVDDAITLARTAAYPPAVCVAEALKQGRPE